ncbi:MAG: hypothetical protein ACOYPR_03435 [Saprospiraceae bacterium]
MTQSLHFASALKCFFILGFFSVQTVVFGQASIPKISFQGVLKTASGEPVPDGEYTFTFSFWKSLTGTANSDKLLKIGATDPNVASNQWAETVALGVAGGIYSHNLGAVTPLNPLNFNGPVYLNIRVGGKDLVPRTEFTYAPFSFSVASAQTVVCSGAVGDIKYSILPPDKFKDVNGDCWVPLDGRSLATTDALYAQGVTTLPNAGGMFIRAQDFSVVSGSEAWKPKNNSDNDPGRTSSTAPGNFQGDENKSHTHTGTTSTNGSHTHTWNNGLEGDDSGSGGSNSEYTRIGGSVSDAMAAAGNHSHTFTTDASGGEARPKNMNFWIYIRIN